MSIVKKVVFGVIGVMLSGMVYAQSITITPSGGGAPSSASPAYVYCDSASVATLTGAAATPVTCPSSAQNVVVYTQIAGQCYPCSAPLSGGDLSGATGSIVGNGCAVVGGPTNLNLSPLSTFNANPAVAASFCAGSPPPPSGKLSTPVITPVTPSSPTAATIIWSASTDSVNPSEVVTYNITLNPSPAAIPSTTNTTVTLNNLQASTTYTATVQATDALNPSGVTSAPITFTTPAPGGGIPAYQTLFYNYFYSQNSGNPYGVNAPPAHFGKFINGVANTQNDARNMSLGNNIYVDQRQIKEAGFSVIRAYQEPATTWVTLINEAAKNNLSVVYQVAACQDVPAGQPHAGRCVDFVNGQINYVQKPDGSYLTFDELVKDQLATLSRVIDEVGPHKFSRVVKLVLAGNEDLFTMPGTNDTTNAADLVSAMSQTRALLNAKSISQSLPVSTSIQADVMMAHHLQSRQTLAQGILSNNSTYPVLAINVYPNQWGVPAICAVNGNCTSSMCTQAANCAMGPQTAAQADQHTLTYYMQQLQNKYSNMPIMITETGWPTSGSNSGYVYPNAFSQADAASYYSAVYPFVTNQQIPLLAFEMYNEAGKSPNNPSDAEVHYGLMSSDNQFKSVGFKSVGLLPPTNTLNAATNAKYDSSGLAYITLTGIESSKVFYPNVVHVTLTRSPFNTPIIDQDMKIYTNAEGNPIWPQLLTQVNDVVAISTKNSHGLQNGVTCNGTVQATPWLGAPARNGNFHIGALFSTTSAAPAPAGGYPGFSTGQICSQLFTTPDDLHSPANVWGVNLMATNTPATSTVQVNPSTTTVGTITTSGTACPASAPCTITSPNLQIPNLAPGTVVTLSVTSAPGSVAQPCVASSTIGAGGIWNPGGNAVGCGSNWTNANKSGQVNPAIWTQ